MLLIIRELQIRTTPAIMVIIRKKKKAMVSVGEDVEKRKLSYTVGGTVNWCRHYGRENGDCSKRLRIEIPYDPAVPLLGIYPKNPKTM